MKLSFIRSEIEHMRRQILLQRKEIHSLQRSGILTKSAEEFFARMLAKVDDLCAARDRQIGKCRIAALWIFHDSCDDAAHNLELALIACWDFCSL